MRTRIGRLRTTRHSSPTWPYGRKPRRLPGCRPHLETLESRMQPGSVFTTGLDLAVLGSSLDLRAEGTDATDSASHRS
jgi:hypothetical protein